MSTQNLKQRKFWPYIFFFTIGPGLVVMLADTDAGSLITSAQSGAVWGYRMLLLQLILIPILFIAQELTVRLGIVTQQGHGELIKSHFGKYWAWLSVGTLLVSCIGAIITEFSGIAGVGHLLGVPTPISMALVIAFMLIVTWTGTYQSTERCAILIGLFEFAFVVVAVMAHPHYHEAVTQMWEIPLHNQQYFYLAAANVGAVVMPWMVFYQQSAVVDKKLGLVHLKSARLDTAIGAIITQIIMVSMMVITAATIGKTNPGANLDTVEQISQALIPFLGKTAGELLFALGMLGASLVAAIVVSLTAAWGLGEVMGYKRSLEHHPKEAPWFYGVYTVVLVLGGILVASKINLVSLSVAVEVMNAILLPIVMGFLYLLAIKALPEPYRLKGKYAVTVGVILGVTAIFGLVAGLSSLA
ncbi:MAG: family metal ion transporter [Gammaproteobacteria bacterium]|nr:family metal ion transporter [Gammaproteobacteria bacterium]